MAEARFELGQNVVLIENENGNGDGVIRNTATGAEVALGDFVDVAGSLGSDTDPVAGTSHFENLDAGSVKAEEATIDNSRLYVQDTEPTDAEEGDVWIDTSQ